MPLTKHRLFKISIAKDTLDFDQVVLKEINEFLSDVNYLYVNHSTTIIEKKTTSGSLLNTFLVISLIYKDLNATEKDLRKVSKRTRETVRKSIVSGEAIPMPKIETEFEKKIKRN